MSRPVQRGVSYDVSISENEESRTLPTFYTKAVRRYGTLMSSCGPITVRVAVSFNGISKNSKFDSLGPSPKRLVVVFWNIHDALPCVR